MEDVHENVIEEWCARVCVYLHAASKGHGVLSNKEKENIKTNVCWNKDGTIFFPHVPAGEHGLRLGKAESARMCILDEYWMLTDRRHRLNNKSARR